MPRNFVKTPQTDAVKAINAKPMLEDGVIKALDFVGTDGATYRVKIPNTYSDTLVILRAQPETRKLYAVVLKGEDGEADTYFYDGPDGDKAEKVIGIWRKKLSIYDDSLSIREHDEPIPDED